MAAQKPYHHGDLAEALVEAAVEVIEADGVEMLSLRDLARRLDVSHGAPAHHFGGKNGLLLAVSQRGYDLLHDDLVTAARKKNPKAQAAVAYVRFAVERPQLFDLMFRRDMVTSTDAALAESREQARSVLNATVAGRPPDERKMSSSAIAAWSIVHGLAELWRSGNLQDHTDATLENLTKSVVRHLRI